MKEHPILFSSLMVRAILDGRKTETRRVIKPQPPKWFDKCHATEPPMQKGIMVATKRYGVANDHLWVRETWAHTNDYDGDVSLEGRRALYRADQEQALRPFRWRPSIHMPKWAARLWLEVVDVRVERVQNITTEGARAEGCPGCRDDLPNSHATTWFRALWNSINAKRGYPWASNPWVWVVRFRRIERPRER